METIAYSAISFAEFLFAKLWFPLLIWTAIALLLLAGLKKTSFLHPQYQYQVRMAILLSLPAGVFLLMMLQGLETFLSSQHAASYNLKLITVNSPLEMGVYDASVNSLFSFYEWMLLAVVFTFIAGAIYSVKSFFGQWHSLKKFRSETNLRHINRLAFLSSKNRELIKRINKPIWYGFVEQEIIPVTFGVREPVILVPHSLKEQPEKCNLAIRHELIHISKNDFLSHLFVTLIQAIFWFHPLVHRLKNELVEYRELRCDSEVLAEQTVSPKLYATLLFELLPMPNINKNLSVNMAQESSNLKKRIQMITNKSTSIAIPKRKSVALFSFIFLASVIAIACTDMQIGNIYDQEELELMTTIDRTGETGFHEITIFMSEEEQAERHESKMEQLKNLDPNHIESISVWKGDEAIEQFGPRGEKGVIQVKTKLDPVSYNTTMRALGLNTVPLQEFTPQDDAATREDFFVVVEEMPELIGGLTRLQTQIRYPAMARRAGIEGRVHIQFIVSEEGRVENAQVVRGIGGGADEEALRVVRQAQFKPGYQRGRPVRVQYSLPIFFRLAENGSSEESQQTSGNSNTSQAGALTIIGYGNR